MLLVRGHVCETHHSAIPDLSSGGEGASTLLVEVSASEDWDNGSDNDQAKDNHNENGVRLDLLSNWLSSG